MNCKDHVVDKDRVKSSRISSKVLSFDFWDPIQTDIEDRVHNKSNNVQRKEVKIEAHDTFSLEIVQDLRIEGDGPGDKVHPSHDIRYDDDRIGNCHSHAHKKVVEFPAKTQFG